MRIRAGILALSTLLLFSCDNTQKENTHPEQIKAVQTVYYGGDIVTMDGDKLSYAEAIVTKNDKVIFVGKKEDALEKYTKADIRGLEGKTLMPGFIEPHLHPSLAAIMLKNEIIAPYDWKLPSGTKKGVVGHEEYIARITEFIKTNAVKDNMYFIWGYHQLWHGELSRSMLNEIAGDQPVEIIHRSFHEIYLNDAAITLLGIQEKEYAGNPQVNWEKGHFYEGGWLALAPKIAPILLEPKGYLESLKILRLKVLYTMVLNIQIIS